MFSGQPSWEPHIRRYGRFTQHELVFGDVKDASAGAFDLVVPLAIPELVFISNQHETSRNTLMAYPTPQAVALLDDKQRFNAFMETHGYESLVPSAGTAQGYPLIAKLGIDANSSHCYLIATPADAHRYQSELAQSNYVVQRFIPGREEYCTHLYVRAGRIVASLGVRYGFNTEYPIKTKDTPAYTALYRCPYLELWAEILNKAGFEGLCCVNYKIWEGRPYVFEINPRMGGSLAVYFFSFVRHIQAQPS